MASVMLHANKVSRLAIGCCLLLGMFVFSSSLSIAALGAPSILNYQGNLTDDQGNPITGQKTMSFRIYPAINSSISEALWVSGDITVQVTNGLFSVNLGESPQPALEQELFSDDSRYLGVTVDGTELTERKRLVSVPYAFSAGSGGIPKGGIIMWSGSVSDIPEGWALCDGQNGTPDLRDRFIVGAGNSYSVGGMGGSLTHAHTINEHVHSDDHTHSGRTNSSDNGKPNRTDGGSTQLAWDHSHPFSTNSKSAQGYGAYTGGASDRGMDSQSNLPPYYALCFIMKL